MIRTVTIPLVEYENMKSNLEAIEKRLMDNSTLLEFHLHTHNPYSYRTYRILDISKDELFKNITKRIDQLEVENTNLRFNKIPLAKKKKFFQKLFKIN
jgi:hypothetical protein